METPVIEHGAIESDVTTLIKKIVAKLNKETYKPNLTNSLRQKRTMGSHHHQVAILVPDDKLDWFWAFGKLFFKSNIA